jgi:hypothetical protein
MLYERFIEGHKDLEDDPRSGHLSSSQNEKVVAKVGGWSPETNAFP